MATETFGQLWNRLLLYAPGTPVPLAQQFVKNAYQGCLDAHLWSGLHISSEKVIPAEYSTGTVSVTNGSQTFALSGATTTSAWAGRQIRIPASTGQPYYTIESVGANSVTVTEPFLGETQTNTTYSIGEYYVEMPSNLKALLSVRSVDQEWRIRGQIFQQPYLDSVDPLRSDTGEPFSFVAAPPRIASDGTSYPRFEFYPQIPAGSHIVIRYVKTHELSSNATRLIPEISSESVIFGALSELCLWPGTAERPNPYFSLDLHKKYTELFEDEIHKSEMNDLERFQQMIIYEDTSSGIPADAEWRQLHGIPV